MTFVSLLSGICIFRTHLLTLVTFSLLVFAMRTTTLENSLAKGKYMLLIHVVNDSELNQCYRFVDKHYSDLEAFFAMREAIDNFKDILPKLSKGKGEFCNNLAKLVCHRYCLYACIYFANRYL